MKASNLLYSLVIAAALLTSCSDSESSDKRAVLFDGKTLDGWTVITCEATVDDGDILLVAGNGLVIEMDFKKESRICKLNRNACQHECIVYYNPHCFAEIVVGIVAPAYN